MFLYTKPPPSGRLCNIRATQNVKCRWHGSLYRLGEFIFLILLEMRKLVILLAVLSLSCCARAQSANDVADTLRPFQKNPKLPAFNIKLMDNETIFNTYNIPAGKPIVLMEFLPDCSHCRKTTQGLLNGMDSVKDVQFYLVTPFHDMDEIKKFYTDFHLADYKNIKVVGRDYEFFFHDFYGIKSVPDMALYDGNKKLVKLFEGETTVHELYKYVH